MFISCLRLSSSNVRIVSSHKQCVAELYLQCCEWGPGFLLAPQMLRVTVHVLNTAPGMLFTFHCPRLLWWGPGSLWFLTATLGSSIKVCSTKVCCIFLSDTKVFHLCLLYFLIGPTLGAKVCHQL